MLVGPVDLLGIYAVCIESHTQILKLLVISKNEKSDKPTICFYSMCGDPYSTCTAKAKGRGCGLGNGNRLKIPYRIETVTQTLLISSEVRIL